ncbi:NEDD4-binding protein 2-like 2 [Megalops cyprinoides]|uniref:NEDD4-binding protein 2-like 2 n=1 Tax=Megalops cyprinoides TaxID=118141 RepID=UPI001864062B|nr:NEDD4-binding protein 2-like 2 [Megalops cyprinoides]
MMPEIETGKPTSGTEEGEAKGSIQHKQISSDVETNPQSLTCEAERGSTSQVKGTEVTAEDGAGGLQYPERGDCPQQGQGSFQGHISPVNCTGDGTNSSLSAEDTEVVPSVCDENQEKPEQKDRNIVMKDLGITSTAFIGPVCRPVESEPAPEVDIEDKLSEFYKELEETESGDCLDGSANSGKRDSESRQPQNPPWPEEERFNTSRDTGSSRGSRPYRYHHRDNWRPKRHRPNFQQGPGWGGPDPPFYPDQWQYPQGFGDPQGPPYHSFHRPPYHRPPGPLPPPPPPGSFYPPDFRPEMNEYYDYRENGNHCQWEDSHFPADSGYPGYDSSGGYDASQGYGGPPYPPNDFDYRRESHDTSVSDCREGGWSQPYGGSEWHQNYDSASEPRPQRHQEEEGLWPPGSDCDYRPNSLLVLILMRGVPGSGKSTLAKKLLSSGPNGLILSTDDYFSQVDGYAYDPSLLGHAHDWNQNRAREAMDDGRSPVIIDNTNIQAWEMKPYVKMALQRGYNVEFCEPDTSWKLDPVELEKRNKHGVSRQKIAQMLERFELPMSVDIVLNSRDPPHKSSERPPAQHLPR